MTFRVGQKVVCVSDLIGRGEDQTRWPSHVHVGGIYTIRGVEHLGAERVLVYLEEYLAPPLNGYEPAFHAQHFRPLISRKNDGQAFVENLKRICRPNEIAKNRELCRNE